MSVDVRWQMVQCKDCKRRYRCTPQDDFYGDREDLSDGRCFACLLRANGMNPETTPVLVVDEDGHEIDPRDGAP
jgi:hypothetical protein